MTRHDMTCPCPCVHAYLMISEYDGIDIDGIHHIDDMFAFGV